MDKVLIELARQLEFRLERLPVDSHWSHQASGLRGSLLLQLEREKIGLQVDQSDFALIIQQGFLILEKAAQDLH